MLDITGVILLGIFASTKVNPAGADGLIHGNAHFFLVETAAVVIAAAYAFVISYGMLTLIDKITPVRVDASEQLTGIDAALHSETAYLM